MMTAFRAVTLIYEKLKYGNVKMQSYWYNENNTIRIIIDKKGEKMKS